MIPPINDMQFCVWLDGEIYVSSNGLCISSTEDDAWLMACDGLQYVRDRLETEGATVRRCYIGVVNP